MAAKFLLFFVWLDFVPHIIEMLAGYLKIIIIKRENRKKKKLSFVVFVFSSMFTFCVNVALFAFNRTTEPRRRHCSRREREREREDCIGM